MKTATVIDQALRSQVHPTAHLAALMAILGVEPESADDPSFVEVFLSVRE